MLIIYFNNVKVKIKIKIKQKKKEQGIESLLLIQVYLNVLQ